MPPNGTATRPALPRQQLTRENIAGGSWGIIGSYARSLPQYIDDVTRDLGADLFERMLMDSQVAAAIAIFKASVLEDGIDLNPAIDDDTEDGYEQATQIRDEAEAMLDGLQQSLDDVLWELAGACALGNRLAEQVYEVRGGSVVNKPLLQLASLKVKPRDSYVFVVDAYTNTLGVIGRQPNQSFPVAPAFIDPANPPANFLGPDKIVVNTFRPKNNDPRGTALDPETLIPTPDGWRKMDVLQPGDKVFDEQGRIRYVTARVDWEDRPCYELSFRGGESIIADENHQWVTHLAWERYQGRDPRVRTTRQIVDTLHDSRGLANHSIAWAKPLDYPEQLLPVQPYFFGLWLGDGTSRSAAISCHVDDLDETVALIGAAGYTATAARNGRSDNGRLIRVGGDKQWDSSGPSHALRLLGVQRDSDGVDQKHIPEAYLRGSIQQRRELLAGLMDADGSVDRDGRCEFSNTNRQLAECVRELVTSLGVPAGIRLHHASHVGADGHSRKDAWGVFFTPPWSPFKLERKTAKTINARAQRQHYIIGTKQVSNRRTVCIETDGPSHMYLAGRAMIPTHNSLLRPAYDPWWRKRQALVEYVKYLAQFAGPSIWATTPEGAESQPPQDFLGNTVAYTGPNATDPLGNPVTVPNAPLSPEQDLLAKLQQFRNGTVAAFPFGTQLNTIAMQGEGRAFLNALAECNISITKAILTQELATEEGEHSTRAAATVHQDVLGTLVRQAKRSMVRLFAKQILVPWVRYNWGDDAARQLTPKVSLGTTEQEDKVPLINAIANSFKSGYIHDSQLSELDTLQGFPVRDLTQDEPGEPEPLDSGAASQPPAAGQSGDSGPESPDDAQTQQEDQPPPDPNKVNVRPHQRSKPQRRQGAYV